MFEYLYWGAVGYWMYPANDGNWGVKVGFSRTMDAKNTRDFDWVLRYDSEDYGATIESRRTNWEEYYISWDAEWGHEWYIRWRHMSSPEDAQRLTTFKFQILCKSCTPSDPNKELFEDCRIMNMNRQYDMYVTNLLQVNLYYWKPIPANWVRWRIISPVTKSYWKRLHTHENCGDSHEPIPAGPYILKTTISHTTSITVSWSIDDKISAGNFALALLKMDPDPTVKAEWSRTDIETIANEKTITFPQVMIPPGQMWTIDQFYGEAAFTLVGSDRFKSPFIACDNVDGDETVPIISVI